MLNYQKKLNENGEIMKNKARLVVQRYCKEEGVDFDEIFAPAAILESIKMMLAFAYYYDFVIYEMDVKSIFQNGFLQEDLHIKQPSGFEDPKQAKYVFIIHKVLYGLKQTPRVWYKSLSSFLISQVFQEW